MGTSRPLLCASRPGARERGRCHRHSVPLQRSSTDARPPPAMRPRRIAGVVAILMRFALMISTISTAAFSTRRPPARARGKERLCRVSAPALLTAAWRPSMRQERQEITRRPAKPGRPRCARWRPLCPEDGEGLFRGKQRSTESRGVLPPLRHRAKRRGPVTTRHRRPLKIAIWDSDHTLLIVRR